MNHGRLVGNKVNNTNMACRDLNNKLLSNQASPAGFCLDTTASGPVPGGWLDAGTPGDGGTPADAGPPADAAPPADAGPPQEAGPPPADSAPPASKLGHKCTTVGTCGPGLTCIMFAGTSTSGFCSKACTTPGSTCPGGPKGTNPICLPASPSQNLCAFFCKDPSGSYACPPQLKCDTSEIVPGSGMYACVP